MLPCLAGSLHAAVRRPASIRGTQAPMHEKKHPVPQALQAGIATVDITPPLGVLLWGYQPRAAERVEHPLRAEALACSSGGSGWILVSADLGAFSSPLASRIRADIAQATGLGRDAVLLLATHTHSGPHVTDALWREQSAQESAYFRELHGKLVDVAVRAWQMRAPGFLVQGRTAAPELGSNRRIQRPDGTWTNEFSDPEGRHTGYFDPTVELFGVRRPEGGLAALLVNYGCHPVCFGAKSTAISADYVGYLKDALEGSGSVGTVLFSVGGHANVDPRHCVQTLPEVVREMGGRLADHVRAALPALAPVVGDGLGCAEVPWEFETTWDIADPRLAMYFPSAGRGERVRTSVCALAAGSLALLGLPGETVSEYRGLFEGRSPFTRTLLLSLANDFVGYLPTDEILAQGAYEARLCPLKPLQAVLTARADAALQQARAAVASTPNPEGSCR